MKRLALLLLFAVLAPACYGGTLPPDFRFTLEHPRVPQTPTVGDDLSQALTAHGMDPVLAIGFAIGVEMALKNNQDLNNRLAADEAAITKLQQQVAALTPATPPPTPHLPIQIAADKCLAPAGCPGAPTQDPASFDGNKIFLSTGQALDYKISIPAAGNYVLSARLCNSQGSTGVTTAHFEFPAGTPVGGTLTLPAGQQWTTLSGTAVALTPAADGTVTLHLVVDASALPVGNGGIMDVVAVTQQ